MLDTIYSKVAKTSSIQSIGIFLALFLIVQTVINGSPYGVAQLNEISGGAGILDLERGYSPDRAYAILTAQGEAGRAFYLRSIIPLDFIFPLAYTLFYLTVNTFILQRLFPETSSLRKLGLLSLVAGLADYVENLCIIVLLLNYPARLNYLARAANALTVTKGLFILASMLLLVAGLLGLVIKATAARVIKRKALTNNK